MSSHYRTPGQDIEAIVDAPATPITRVGPDGRWLLQIHYTLTPPLEMIARPFHRLGGLRIDAGAGVTRRTYNMTRVELSAIGGQARHVLELPEGALRFASVSWAPTGDRLAASVFDGEGLSLWVAAEEDGWRLRRPTETRLNDTLGVELGWMPGGRQLLIAAVPEGRGPEPAAPLVPQGPKIQVATGREAQNRTYQDLLEDAQDDALFEHYTRSELRLLDLETGEERVLLPPSSLAAAIPSPSGEYLLVKHIERPFSRVVPVYYFGRTIEIVSLTDGATVRQIVSDGPAEDIPIQGVRTGPRRVAWQATAAATVCWAEALDGGDPRREVEHRDRLMRLEAPFDGEPDELLRVEERYRGTRWFEDERRFLVTEYDRDRRWVTKTLHDLGGDEPRVLFDRSVHDRYNDPGYPLSRRRADGTRAVILEQGHIYLAGPGATPDGDRPFLDRMNLETGETERLFRSAEDRFEDFIGFGPGGEEGAPTMVLRRESPTSPPNFFWTGEGGGEVQLTAHEDPHPELTGLTKKLLRYERADGVPLSGTLYLPPDYEEGQRLPLVVWAYPLEYNDADTAGQVRAQPTRFTRLWMTSPLMFVTRGYAVLDRATVPIVGDPETMNDTFVEQIVSSAQAAIDAVVAEGVADPERVGVGGHSYGAFMTANLLAHCDLFRAGIARSGAYNRSLTPFGFQSERRTLWEARDTYVALSPFFQADQIEAPLLLIHGEVDNNSGTYPLQSRRLFHAIQGLGGTARLVVLPHESHGYRARESVLHVLAEQFDWFDRHVKGEG